MPSRRPTIPAHHPGRQRPAAEHRYSPIPSLDSDARFPPLRTIERNRRALSRFIHRRHLPLSLLIDVTCSSFRMEHLLIDEREIQSALTSAADRRAMRPPHSMRIRNHLAILRWIERAAVRRQVLKLPAVVRWYTSISCGLSIASVDQARAEHLQACLRRINSPLLGPQQAQQALQEIAQIHIELLADPPLPGFNGILSRLLLQFHLARCQFPPVVFDPAVDHMPMANPASLAPRLAELICQTYDRLLRKTT